MSDERIERIGKRWNATVAATQATIASVVADEATAPELVAEVAGTPLRVTAGPTVDEWRQPVGAHDAYGVGARVTHNGQMWESTAAENVWEPGVYGWEAVT